MTEIFLYTPEMYPCNYVSYCNSNQKLDVDQENMRFPHSSQFTAIYDA